MSKADSCRKLRKMGGGDKLVALFAALCAAATSLPSFAATNITEDAVLDASADWRGLGTVTVAEGATLDLRGHDLQVTDIAGSGTITSDYGITPLGAPEIVTNSAIFWLDAADESTLTKNTWGAVTAWTSKAGDKRTASVRNTSKCPVYRRYKYGRPCVDFGALVNDASGVDMTYTRFTNIKMAFFAFKIAYDAFPLADSSTYNFHRGGSGYYVPDKWHNVSKVWNGTSQISSPNTTVLPSNSFQTVTYLMKSASNSDCLSVDRAAQNVSHRSGGRQLCEVILFSSELTDTQREEVVTYLQQKWGAFDAVPTLGELRVDVASGVAVTNSTVTLGGNVRLVKEGEGTYVANKMYQRYYGGTEVREGTLMPHPGNSKTFYYLNTTELFGVRESTILATTNGANVGTFDMNGLYGQKDGSFILALAGGVIRQGTAWINENSGQMGTIALDADSTFKVDASCMQGVPSATRTYLNLGGNTLALEIASGKTFTMSATVADAGVLSASGAGVLKFGNSYSKALGIAATNTTFRIACPIQMQLNSGVSVDVGDYEAAYTGGTNTGGNPLKVFGTFKPTVNRFYGCTMMDGSTIDLTSWPESAGWPAYSRFTRGLTNVTFAAGAAVTVDIHGLDFAPGDRILSWAEAPADADGVTFAFDAETAEAGIPPVVGEDGLYYGAADTTVTVAHWTGAAGDNDIANAANWACTNAYNRAVTGEGAIPGEFAKVYVAGEVAFQVTAEDALECLELHLGNLSIAGDDIDWRGLGSDFYLDGTIDLAGNTLRLSGLPSSGTITSSAETVGELHIEVAEGATVRNADVTLSGALKLVKDGLGTLVAEKTAQTYTGGTTVTEGTLQAVQNSYLNTSQIFGAHYSTILATTNGANVGTFDMNGLYGQMDGGYELALAGGVVLQSSQKANENQGQIGTISLLADSTFRVNASCMHGNPSVTRTYLNLGGNTLALEIASGKTFTMAATIADAGVLSASGAGVLKFGNPNSKAVEIAATNTAFRIACPIQMQLNSGVSVDVGDYEAVYAGSTNTGTNPLKVFGTFKPSAHDVFYGCTMMDGSTIDLSSRTNALPRVSSFASGSNELKFDDGATVYVRLGGRRFPGGKVVSWASGSGPDNADTLKFKSVAGERRCHFAVRDDGLYAQCGFTMIVR